MRSATGLGSEKSPTYKSFSYSTNTVYGTHGHKPRPTSKLLWKIILIALTVGWIVHHTCICPQKLRYLGHETPLANTPASSKSQIPNQVHFVKLLQNPGSLSEFSFHFSEFLSVYAAWHYWRPPVIYLHTNAANEVITGARGGRCGKWSKLILQTPSIKVLYAAAPTHAENGAVIKPLDHQVEFVATSTVRDMGGIYLGFDVHALRDIRTYRDRGFSSVLSAPDDVASSHDFFMSSEGSPLVEAWADGMERTYTMEQTSSPSDTLLPVVANQSKSTNPRQLLFMDATAFVSDKHNETLTDRLFRALHADSGFRPFSTSSRQVHRSKYRPAVHHDDLMDWSNTYLLQVTNSHEAKWTGRDLEHITPRHVLGRRSNFARAVYPITKLLYDNGVIQQLEK